MRFRSRGRGTKHLRVAQRVIEQLDRRLLKNRMAPVEPRDRARPGKRMPQLIDDLSDHPDARGVISVTERAAYIGRVRALARACCETWLAGSRE